MSTFLAASADQEPPLDKQTHWAAVFALSFGLFGMVTTELLPIGLITPMASDLGVSVGAAGQAVSVTALIAAIAGPVLVLGARNLDRRQVVWSLGALFFLSTLMAAFSPNLTVLLISRGVLGFALGGSWALAIALAMRLVPPGALARALSIVFTGVSVANVIAAPLGAYLSDVLSWRATLMIASGIAILGFVGALATLPKLPATTPPSISSFRFTLSRPAIVIGLLTVFFVLCGNTAGISFIRPFLATAAAFDVQAISIVLLIFGVAGFVGNLIGGALASRSPALTAAGAAILIAFATFFFARYGANHFIAIIGPMIWGLGFGAFPVAISSWNSLAAPDHAESAGALLSTGFQVAIASGAAIGGMLVDSQGFDAPIYSAAAAALVGSFIMLVAGVRSERKRQKVG